MLTKGKKVVASGQTAALTGAGKLTLKAKKALKAGAYRLTITAVSTQGVVTVKTIALKIRK